ncbi:MAG: DUF488 domain-containing protein [Planctomycetes bacterium]|nr:DUF488 domain-containing protein [Planctomycetota bacterium]
MSRATLFTVGHSNRSADELVELLREDAIEVLVDVRRFPTSQRNPQFEKGALQRCLALHGVRYRHEEALGGHRVPLPASRNLGLADPALRGYADHTRTPAFRAAAERVVAAAREARVVLLCAEARPEGCHRAVLADWLVAQGHEVVHLVSVHERVKHGLDPCVGRDERGEWVWRARQGELFGGG